MKSRKATFRSNNSGWQIKGILTGGVSLCAVCRVVSLNAYAPTSDRYRVTQKENINFTIPLIICKIKEASSLILGLLLNFSDTFIQNHRSYVMLEFSLEG